jgi:hypothetical protein
MCCTRGRTRGSCWPAARPAQIDAFKTHVRGLGIDGQVVFTGERPASEIPDLLAGGGRARVAEKPRHEHAVEDLPVPRVRPRHRGHSGCSPTRRCSTTTWQSSPKRRQRRSPRDPAADRRTGCGHADRRRGGATGATKYSYEAYLARTREAIGRLGADSRETLSGSAA